MTSQAHDIQAHDFSSPWHLSSQLEKKDWLTVRKKRILYVNMFALQWTFSGGVLERRLRGNLENSFSSQPEKHGKSGKAWNTLLTHYAWQKDWIRGRGCERRLLLTWRREKLMDNKMMKNIISSSVPYQVWCKCIFHSCRVFPRFIQSNHNRSWKSLPALL